MSEAQELELVVIGSGAAGLMAALNAVETVPVALLTDRSLGRSNTIMAQGGLQFPEESAPARAAMVRDMVASARGGVDEARAESFVSHIGATMEQLAAWGLDFDRTPDGGIRRKLAGGLSEPRIASVKDQIGPALMRVLRERLEASEVQLFEHLRVTEIEPAEGRLLLHTEPTRGEGPAKLFSARAVVCCTGGLTFRHARDAQERTTNPANDNERLFAALRARGLATVDEDVFQYQPFGLVEFAEGKVDKCVPESVTNLGVRLVDKDGEEVCPVRQDRLDLTRALFRARDEGRCVDTEHGPGVWLTLSDVEPAVIEAELPKLAHILQRKGWVGKDVLVFPFLHYHLGGFVTEPDGSTPVEGLYLAGEMVGGLHGQNRLMGNGITDSLVHGRLSGLAAAAWLAAKGG
jgi:succinate dehydrogenase/fumarate reductase flavoprotein subunit